MTDKVKHVFNTHPSVNVLHETEDGTIFLKDNDALAHKQTKGFKKDIVEHKRVVEETVLFPEGEPSEDWKKDELKAYADANSVEYKNDATKADLVTLIEISKEN